MWDFSTPKHYLHDGISSYQLNPRVNANGPIYGAPEESTDNVPVVDPVKNRAYTIKHPVRDPETPDRRSSCRCSPRRTGAASRSGTAPAASTTRRWMQRAACGSRARFRPAPNPDFCKKGSDHPSAKVMPLDASPRQALGLRSEDAEVDARRTPCFTTHHLLLRQGRDDTLWTSQGGPQSGVVGWLKTKQFLATGDSAKSQGWMPIIVDTNGNGKRDEFVGPNDPVDPAKDKRLTGGLLRHHAEPGGRLGLGPVDGHRLRAHRSARVHHPPHARVQSRARPRSPKLRAA